MAGAAERTVVWGRADDGALVRVELMGATVAAPGEWWPPQGLQLVDTPAPDTEAAHEICVDVGDPQGWDRVESDLGLFTAERLADVVAVHAAVLVCDGAMVVVPGVSMTGKTSLCAAALAAGVQVWSDEYALVNPQTGEVRGWPRRLRVRTTDGGAERVQIDGAYGAGGAMVPTLVAAVQFSGDMLVAGEVLTTSPMNEAEMMFVLLSNTVCAQSRPEIAFEAAMAVATRARGVQGERGDAAAALALLCAIARKGA